MSTLIHPKKIRIDLDVQSRVELNEGTVNEYVASMESGDIFPPIHVFFDENNNEFILADGFHRFAAHQRVRPNDQIEAIIELGTSVDAEWMSVGSNTIHGLARTNDDKHKATQKALINPKGTGMSDREIARYVKVSHTNVQNIRRELELSGKICQIESRTVQRGNQTYTQNTSKIGRSLNTVHVCRDCRYFAKENGNACCEIDSTRTGIIDWTVACEDFAILVEEPPPREMPPPDYDNIVEHIDKSKSKSRHSQNQRLKGCISLALPKDNPSLFAVELRNAFEAGYLIECFAALKGLLEDDES
jgi:Predicted transcriptional regulators